MRRIVLIVVLMWGGVVPGVEDNYNELITKVIRACENPRILLTTAFTNEVMTYRAMCADEQGRCAADLALAISLMHRMEHEEACVASDSCFRSHQILVSNIVCCSSLDVGSWLRYAAAVEYLMGLNYGNQRDAVFQLSTNMVAKIARHPPDMGVTNYWNAMSIWMESPNETLSTVFRLNAAIWLSEHNREAEIVSLTNSLPARAILLLQDELGDKTTVQ